MRGFVGRRRGGETSRGLDTLFAFSAVVLVIFIVVAIAAGTRTTGQQFWRLAIVQRQCQIVEIVKDLTLHLINVGRQLLDRRLQDRDV